MNIRSLSNPAQILAQDKIDGQKRDIRSSQTADRDANGQQAFGDGGKERSLNEEELQQVLEKIQNHPGIKANGLIVEALVEEDRPWVVVKDPAGKIIKKINGMQLSQYLDADDPESFSLVRKTA